MAIVNRIIYGFLYRISKPRWDNGQVPPQVVQLVSAVGNIGNALDLGCGTGTHSIFLAQQGLTVTGIDFSETAIRKAREKASQARVSPEFVIHDVTRLDFLRGPFDIALDVGCLHGLGAAEQRRYASALSRLMKAGSRLLVWGIDTQSIGFGLTPVKMERLFSPAFKLERTENVQLHQRPSKWYWLSRL